jgi:hypothetical protein
VSEFTRTLDAALPDAVAGTSYRVDLVPVGAGTGRARRRRGVGRQRIELRLGLGHRGLDGILETGGGVLDLGLELAQFVELHLPIDVRFHVGDITLQLAHPGACLAGHLGQALRSEHHQRHDGDEQQFREAEVEHDRSPAGRGIRATPTNAASGR